MSAVAQALVTAGQPTTENDPTPGTERGSSGTAHLGFGPSRHDGARLLASVDLPILALWAHLLATGDQAGGRQNGKHGPRRSGRRAGLTSGTLSVFEARLVQERFDEEERQVADERGDADFQHGPPTGELVRLRKKVHDCRRDEDTRCEGHERMQAMAKAQGSDPAGEDEEERQKRGERNGNLPYPGNRLRTWTRRGHQRKRRGLTNSPLRITRQSRWAPVLRPVFPSYPITVPACTS